MTIVSFVPGGRLGNALFRYFAIAVVLSNNTSFTYSHDMESFTWPNMEVCDAWIETHLRENKIKNVELHGYSLIMNDYYQLQVLLEYREQIKLYIKEHPNHNIYVEPPYFQAIRMGDLMSKTHLTEQYDIVIHLRLEDRMKNNDYVSPESLINLFEMLTSIFFVDKKICIVSMKPESIQEHDYIDTVMAWFKIHNIDITCVSNTLYVDFHIMMNASVLICTMSTISWSAAFLSDNVTECYMPKYTNQETRIQRPIENTILYDLI